VDYCARRRDPELERDRNRARAKLLRTADAVAALGELRDEVRLNVRSELCPEDSRPGDWIPSTLARELEFLLSHTVHHFALVAVLLAVEGATLPEELADFGVAPSTLRHREKTGPR
jgi:hypothetical protein